MVTWRGLARRVSLSTWYCVSWVFRLCLSTPSSSPPSALRFHLPVPLPWEHLFPGQVPPPLKPVPVSWFLWHGSGTLENYPCRPYWWFWLLCRAPPRPGLCLSDGGGVETKLQTSCHWNQSPQTAPFLHSQSSDMKTLARWCLKVPISPHTTRREVAIVQRDLLPKRVSEAHQVVALPDFSNSTWWIRRSPWHRLARSQIQRRFRLLEPRSISPGPHTLCCLLSAHCWIKQMWSLKPTDPTVKSWIIEKEKTVKENGVRNIWLNEDGPEAPSAFVQGFLNVAFHYSNTHRLDLCQAQGHTLEFLEQTIDECKWSGF